MLASRASSASRLRGPVQGGGPRFRTVSPLKADAAPWQRARNTRGRALRPKAWCKELRRTTGGLALEDGV